MKSRTIYIIIILCLYFAVAITCQIFAGDFPSFLFEFPINIALMILWIAVIWTICREKRCSRFINTFASTKTSLTVIGIFITACAIQGFSSGKLTGSWWFVASTALLLTQLLAVTIRGLSRKRPRKLRFALLHIGLLLALGGGFWGSPDTKAWRIPVTEDKARDKVIDANGRFTYIEQSLRLKSSSVEFYPDGQPKDYTAVVSVDDKQDIMLKVNHPYALSWKDDLYLSSINDGFCILEIVRQPWKYVQWCGIWMLIAGCVLMFAQGTGESKNNTRNDNVE